MTLASGFEEFDRNNVIYDVETFEAMFQDGLEYNPHTAESLAFLMFKMAAEITRGPEGLEKAINTQARCSVGLSLHRSPQAVIPSLPVSPGRLAARPGLPRDCRATSDRQSRTAHEKNRR